MFADGKKHKTRHISVGSSDVAILAFSALMILPGCTKVKTRSVPEIISFKVPDENHLDVGTEILKVMTLNLGHGKGRGILQEFVSNKKTRANLDKVVELLDRERPHIVAFQEADIKSRRSGNFNHVHYIAERAGYGQVVHSQHVKGFGLNHGTALISRLRMSNPLSVTFDPALPSPDKGFTICTVELDAGPRQVDVVSVHLDLASSSARRRQVRQMAAFLSGRANPLVVMGDFNCQLPHSKEVFDILSDQLSLSAYELHSEDQPTYRFLKRRFDWILISPELKFHSHTVLEDRLSDHFAVVSELAWANKHE